MSEQGISLISNRPSYQIYGQPTKLNFFNFFQFFFHFLKCIWLLGVSYFLILEDAYIIEDVSLQKNNSYKMTVVPPDV